MIIRSSPLIDRSTREGMLCQADRSQVVSLLTQENFSTKDIAFALNCSRSLVGLLLIHPYRFLYAPEETVPVDAWDPPGFRESQRQMRLSVLDHLPAARRFTPFDQRNLAQHLAIEVRQWLCAFELTDADRQHVIEQAGYLLDESPLTPSGKYAFNVNRTLLELRRIWRPRPTAAEPRDFKTLLSEWLASWIRFWNIHPEIWDRAVDRELAYFRTQAQAALIRWGPRSPELALWAPSVGTRVLATLRAVTKG
jgi:hypothetical protein